MPERQRGDRRERPLVPGEHLTGERSTKRPELVVEGLEPAARRGGGQGTRIADHHLHGSVRRPQVLDLQLADRAFHTMLFDVLEQMANDLIQQLLRAENLQLALLGRFERRLRLVRLKELLHALTQLDWCRPDQFNQ